MSKTQKVIFLFTIFMLQKANLQFTNLQRTNQHYKALFLLAVYQNQWIHNYYRQRVHLAQYFQLIMRWRVSMLSSLMGHQICLLFSFHFQSQFLMLPLSPCLFYLVVTFVFLPSQPLVFRRELMQLLYLQHLIFSFFLIILIIPFSFSQALFSFKFLISFLLLPFLKS